MDVDRPLPLPLPARQRDVINLIVRLTEEHGYPPTLAELAQGLGLKNRMTVHQHVAALKKKGLVHWEPGLNRSIRVLSEGLAYCEGHESSHAPSKSASDANSFNSRRSASSAGSSGRGIPLAGAIAAGSPIDALETREYLEIESQYGEGCFALKVKGESMIEDGIFDGDFVIVKPNPSPLNGEIVVALLDDGSATLKRFFKENGGFRLQPANSSMQPIFVSGGETLDIQGTVVALFRKM